jgi:hypothetical protein
MLGEEYLYRYIYSPKSLFPPKDSRTTQERVQEYLNRAKTRSEGVSLPSNYKDSDVHGKLDYLFSRMSKEEIGCLMGWIDHRWLNIISKSEDCHYETYNSILPRMGEPWITFLINDLDYMETPESSEVEDTKLTIIKTIQRLISEGAITIDKSKRKVIKLGERYD